MAIPSPHSRKRHAQRSRDVRIAALGAVLFVGVDGRVLGLSAADLRQLGGARLPIPAVGPVEVLPHRGFVYAGGAGVVCKLDLAGRLLATSTVLGPRRSVVRLAAGGAAVIAGVEGRAIALRSLDLRTLWVRPLANAAGAPVALITHRADSVLDSRVSVSAASTPVTFPSSLRRIFLTTV